MHRLVGIGRGVIVAVVCVGAGTASVVAAGVWKGTCAKCGHEWVRYAAPVDAYEVCTFRPDDRGWCGGRILWDRDPAKK